MEIPTWNYGSICGELEYLVRVHMHAIKLEVPGKVHIRDSELAIIFSQLSTKGLKDRVGVCYVMLYWKTGNMSSVNVLVLML